MCMGSTNLQSCDHTLAYTLENMLTEKISKEIKLLDLVLCGIICVLQNMAHLLYMIVGGLKSEFRNSSFMIHCFELCSKNTYHVQHGCCQCCWCAFEWNTA
jgi:hypothetical protein